MDIADPKAETDLPAFASFGHGSHIVEPFTVSCPERIDIGEDVYIGPGAWFSVVDEHHGRRHEPQVWIGHGTSLGPGLVIACIGEMVLVPAHALSREYPDRLAQAIPSFRDGGGLARCGSGVDSEQESAARVSGYVVAYHRPLREPAPTRCGCGYGPERPID